MAEGGGRNKERNHPLCLSIIHHSVGNTFELGGHFVSFLIAKNSDGNPLCEAQPPWVWQTTVADAKEDGND